MTTSLQGEHRFAPARRLAIPADFPELGANFPYPKAETEAELAANLHYARLEVCRLEKAIATLYYDKLNSKFARTHELEVSLDMMHSYVSLLDPVQVTGYLASIFPVLQPWVGAVFDSVEEEQRFVYTVQQCLLLLSPSLTRDNVIARLAQKDALDIQGYQDMAVEVIEHRDREDALLSGLRGLEEGAQDGRLSEIIPWQH